MIRVLGGFVLGVVATASAVAIPVLMAPEPVAVEPPALVEHGVACRVSLPKKGDKEGGIKLRCEPTRAQVTRSARKAGANGKG